MPQPDRSSLWNSLSAAARLTDRALWGPDASVTLEDLRLGSSLGGRLDELRDRSVLIATGQQLTAGLALIELDGIARRLVLCPPDLAPEHVPFVVAAAAVDAGVTDQCGLDDGGPRVAPFVTCSPGIVPVACTRAPRHRTEWILLTSGTTGPPKMVVHTLSTLTGAIRQAGELTAPAVWSTFYDIRRYGGLQIFLRALLGGGSLVLSSPQEPVGDFLIRAGSHGVSHISGTPSHWRRALMSPLAHKIAPRYVRLSGEIADQAILDHLRAFYPEASIAHAFASTEAGVAFDVGDGLAGFPATLIGRQGGDVEMAIEDGSLRIRARRTALRYLGSTDSLTDGDGFVDTGDIVERRGDRYHFVGRRHGIINVGGLKVHPEEVEAVINGHPKVRMSLVRARKNPITGALVVADVVPRGEAPTLNGQAVQLEREILQLCRDSLPRYKVPAAITFVPALAVAATGKILRRHA
jgi:acyl-CoA synthetase (AMP-forming)/AMP-acid ligase II